jgi:hypothetical protein
MRYFTVTKARGVTVAALLHAPCPTPFVAATRNVYAVPLLNPVTVALVAVLVPSLNVVHDEPELLLYCTE